MVKLFANTTVLLLCMTFLFADQSSELNYHQELEKIRGLVGRIEERKLENGIKLAILRLEHAPTFTYVVGVRAGSVDEPKNQKGIAHFLEHLAFKGTKTIGTKDFSREEPLLKRLWELEKELVQNKLSKTERDEMKNIRAQLRDLWITEELQARLADLGGLDINASTSADFTKYYGRYPSESFNEVMSIELSRLLEVVPRQFHEERQVILQERSMRVENDPVGRMYERFIELAFPGEPYRYPVIGYAKDLLRLTPYDLLRFHQDHYVGDNVAVSLVGSVTKEDEEHLKTLFARIPANDRKTLDFTPKKRFSRGIQVSGEFGTKAIMVGFKKDVFPSLEDVCASLASRALFDSKFGLVTKKIVEEDRLVSGVSSAEVPGVRFPNVILIYLPTLIDADTNSVVKSFWKHVADGIFMLKDEGLIDRVKGMIVADVARVLENRMSLADWMVESLLLYGSTRQMIDIVEKLLALEAREVFGCAEDIFRKENSVVLISNK